MMTVMWWYGNGMDGWGYALMTVSTLVFWGLVVVAVVAAVRYLGGRDRAEPKAPEHAEPMTPQRMLADRFARGEIDEAEYRHRLDTLHTTTGPSAGR
jgi:putative membrane protein